MADSPKPPPYRNPERHIDTAAIRSHARARRLAHDPTFVYVLCDELEAVAAERDRLRASGEKAGATSLRLRSLLGRLTRYHDGRPLLINGDRPDYPAVDRVDKAFCSWCGSMRGQGIGGTDEPHATDCPWKETLDLVWHTKQEPTDGR